MHDGLKYYQLLREMSFRISSKNIDVGKLENPETNTELFNELINGNMLKFISYLDEDRNFSISELKDVSDNRKEIYGIDFKNKSIIYYSKILTEDNHIPLKDKWFTQEMVWQSINYNNKGLARNLIFNLYLDKLGTMIADESQTIKGETFWNKLIEQSFQKGVYVYLVDLRDGEVQKINNKEEWITIKNNPEEYPWSEEMFKGIDMENHNEYFRNLRMAISLNSNLK